MSDNIPIPSHFVPHTIDVLQLWHDIHCSTSYTVLYASLTLSHLGQLCKTHTAICLLSPDTLDTYLVLLQSLQSA